MSTDGSIPSLSPPAGGDRNRGPTLAVTLIVFHVIATVFLLARLFVRCCITKKLWLDDLFISVAYMLWITAAPFTAFAIRSGLGRHEYYLSLTPELLLQLVQVIKWQFLSEILTAFSLLATRISVCLFLLRIFGTIKQWKWILYIVTSFITITNLSSLSIILAECRPLSKNWNPLVPGKCISPAVINFEAYYNGAISVVSDWTLAGLPILCMWNVQMRLNVKVGICTIMALGFFIQYGGLCSCPDLLDEDLGGGGWGCNMCVALARRQLCTSYHKLVKLILDVGNIFALDITVIIEQDIGFIAACIPTLKPLFRLTKQKIRSLTGKSTNDTAPETFDDQRQLHRVPGPLSLSELSSQNFTGKHQTNTTGGFPARHDDLSLGSLGNRNGDEEAGGIRKTVDVEWETDLQLKPSRWSPMSHPRGNRAKSYWV